MSSKVGASFHALLTDEYLAVANRGRAFTREGLRAVCQAHLSPKGKNSSTPIQDEADAEQFLREVRRQRLDAYKSCPSDLVEHAQAEEVLRSEYAGRILPELLQNAHDATGAKPIGSKGVGFKAVLNICGGPRIHSGPLHCGFDRHRSRKKFQEAGLVQDNEGVPLMRLPFPVKEEREPQPVRDLSASYDTVVVLPFLDQNARDQFLKEWDEYAKDATLLLFLPVVDCIIWERCDGAITNKRVWRRECQGTVIEIHEDEDTNPVDRWRMWSSERAAIALRLDEMDLPTPDEHYPNIRAFFETDERSPLPILVHADLPLKEGRANVLIDDPASKAETDRVTQEVVRLVATALGEVRDAGLFLDLLRPRVEPGKMEKLEGKLWEALNPALSCLEVPGACGIQLGQVRLRPIDESPHSRWWFDCNLWNAFKEVLSDHRVGQLSGLPLLFPGVDTEEREKTILHFNLDARLSAAEFRGLPLLPVEGSERPVAPSQSIIFFPPKESPPSPPAGIELRFLNGSFVEAIGSHEKRDDLQRLLTDVLEVCEFTPRTLVEEAILPILRTGRQPEDLLDFLSHVVVPALGKDDLIFDWCDSVRRELTERILVPVQDGTSLPAVQVYAGDEWTGTDFLERTYGERSDCSFLHPPSADEEERERWEKLYRWIGVGWCPKVLPIVCHATNAGTHKGPQWDNGVFSIEDEPPGWREYCANQFDHFENRDRRARLRQNWTLDGGSKVLKQERALSLLNENWGYYSKYRQAVYFNSSNRAKDYDNDRRSAYSYFVWLLQTSRWVPVKGTPGKQKPEDVFSRHDIAQELTGWGYELNEEADDKFLEAIGVRSGWRQLQDGDWQRWLERATGLPKQKVNESSEIQRALYRLYDAALRHWSGKDGYPAKPPGTWSGPVWRMERHPDNTESWQLVQGREDVYFVDRPDLADLRLPGLWVFPVRLNRLDKAAKERFGLELLSEHLSGRPDSTSPDHSAGTLVRQRVEERLPVVNAYLERAHSDNLPGLAASGLPDVKVVQSLRVQFLLDNQVLGNSENRDVHYSQDDGAWTLWVDHSLFDVDGKPVTSVWEYVASAIVYASDLPLDVQPILKDLFLYEGADLKRKLLSLGVTQETVDRITAAPHREEEAASPTGDVAKQSGESRGEDEQHKQATPGPPPTPTVSAIPPSGGGGSGGRSAHSGSGSGGPRLSPADPPGREAQEWMREELRNRLGKEGWQISVGPTHDEELRETDIELHHNQFGTFHVEVKHREKEPIYWSENEVEKAKQNPDRYIMVILSRSRENSFEEYWLSKPLEDLGCLPRAGVWTWRERCEDVELPGDVVDWDIPAPKPERPANFSFKVEIGRDWLCQNGQSFEEIKEHFKLLAHRKSRGV